MRGPFFELTAWLYYACFLLLAGLCLFIACMGNRQPDQSRHQSYLRRLFLGLSICLLLWQLTLFSETRTTNPTLWLWLGRLNFAVMVLAPFLALLFVQQVACQSLPYQSSSHRYKPSLWSLIGLETWLLTLLTLLTPWVDAAERVENGHAITTFGPLLLLYALHVGGYWAAALLVAWRKRRQAQKKRMRDQLTLVAGGILTTGAIALVTNLLLPYFWGDFRFCDIGPLSVFVFLFCVAYATFLRHLFALGVVLRAALVHGILLAFVLGAYSSAVFVISQTLTASAGLGTQFAVLVIAFSFDPLRRFLEEKADRLLFGESIGERKDKRVGENRELKKPRLRRGQGRTLALLFPWRHL